MPLPKISTPVFTIKDSTGKQRSFRPMLVREEKLLLMAKESSDQADVLAAIKQVVNNCVIDAGFEVDKLPLFELEHAFLKLRGFSVGNKINVSYKDNEDEKVYNFTVDLDKVETRIPKIEKKIPITPTAGIILRYPSAALYGDAAYSKLERDEAFFKLVASCVEFVYDGERVYERKDFTEEELLDFIDRLEISVFERVKEFMLNLPSLYYKIEYKNANGNDRTIELVTLSDFFTLR